MLRPVWGDSAPSAAPAGSLHMSVSDLARFGQLHLSAELGRASLLSAAAFRDLRKPPQAIDRDSEPSRTDERGVGCPQGNASRYICLSFFSIRIANQHKRRPEVRRRVGPVVGPSL